MTTSRPSTLVSLAAAATVLLALGGCVTPASRAGAGEGSAVAPSPRTVPFENSANDYVHVYLVSEQHQWFLGRVEQGARVDLQIPQASLSPDAGLMRLVVILGAQMTPKADRDRRASIAVAQPAVDLVRQRWTMSQGMLSSEPRR